MSARDYQVLSEEQVQHFLNKGYLVVKNCFEKDVAQKLTDRAFERLGYDKNNPDTWEKDIIWMDHETMFQVKDIAPKAWAAICDVVGGEDRIRRDVMTIESKHFSRIDSFAWSDAFILNLRYGADQPWQPPSPQLKGWHMDGNYFRHFLDSPEQALLTIVLWSDVLPQSGGTFIACDSVPLVARYLYEHPEGIRSGEVSKLIAQCNDFVEVTGETGDFIILHPFILHASSPNPSGRPRFMTNPPVMLAEPMNFNREDPADFSLLEWSVLQHLGLERLDFQPTAPREKLL